MLSLGLWVCAGAAVAAQEREQAERDLSEVTAAIVDIQVSVVAILHSSLHIPIATKCLLTVIQAVVGVIQVAVIAFFFGGRQLAITAKRCWRSQLAARRT